MTGLRLRWRYISLRRRMTLFWRIRVHPSQLQRDFSSSDPERHARVQAWADAIRGDMDQEDRS